MIYLDHNATSPLDPRVLEAMLPWLRGIRGNASSRDHVLGWDARDAVEDAREKVAALLNARPGEIIFVSGASEAILLALQGTLGPGRKGLISAVEHEAVRGTCRALAARGAPIGAVGVDPSGRFDLAGLRARLSAGGVALVCAMAANNETGVTFPLREIAGLAHAAGARFFTDAAQALGKAPLDADGDGFDLAAFSAHKLGGPQGVGALYVRGGTSGEVLESPYGGGQEGGLRAGTLNVAAIVGFGEACRLNLAEGAAERPRLGALRDRLEAGLRSRFPGLRVNGAGAERLANTSNLTFPGADARALLRALPGIAASTRSACSSGSPEPSHVLTAMGLPQADALASIRFSAGRQTTAMEIDSAILQIGDAYARLKEAGA